MYKIDFIDVKSGSMTYGARLALDELIRSSPSSANLFKGVFKALYDVDINISTLLPATRMKYVKHVKDVIDGIHYWYNLESKLLNEPVSSKQEQAGLKRYLNNVGYMATVKALAQTYSQDPDVILSWEYSKVFNLLYTDLEEYRYRKRLDSVINRSR